MYSGLHEPLRRQMIGKMRNDPEQWCIKRCGLLKKTSPVDDSHTYQLIGSAVPRQLGFQGIWLF